MKWLYNVDLFFWNLQKISTFIIVCWLIRLWWRRDRGKITDLFARLKRKEPVNRILTKLRAYHSQLRAQATMVFRRRKKLNQ
jgi:hypothetical protein